MATENSEDEFGGFLGGEEQAWLLGLALPVDVRCCFLAYDDVSLPSQERLHAALSPAESAYFEALAARSSVGRVREWLLGRLCSKSAVRRLLEAEAATVPAWQAVSILPDRLGKPVVDIDGAAGADLGVSLSHTRAGVLGLAVRGTGSIGIDLESVDRAPANCQAFARHVLSEAEQAEVDFAAGCGERLLRYWVAKEAAAKALGTGFQGQPKHFVLTRSPTGGHCQVRHGDDSVPVYLGGWGDFLLAVAYHDTGPA